MDIEELLRKFKEKDRLACSKLITLLENESVFSRKILSSIFPLTGKAYKIGITGPPGVGKSTLVNELAKIAQKKGFKIGIIAVDPTSPFTGGAFLGDRLRMNEISTEKEIFIRSMASRGSLGGISPKTYEASLVLDAFGKDLIFIETIGVGQAELDVIDNVDTTIVILVPESGDAVQGMKAGLIEAADLLVVNKADREGAEILKRDLEEVISFKKGENSWKVRVFLVSAYWKEGIIPVFEEILNHQKFLLEKNLYFPRRKENVKKKLKELLQKKIEEELHHEFREDILENFSSEIIFQRIDPYLAVDKILQILKQ